MLNPVEVRRHFGKGFLCECMDIDELKCNSGIVEFPGA